MTEELGEIDNGDRRGRGNAKDSGQQRERTRRTKKINKYLSLVQGRSAKNRTPEQVQLQTDKLNAKIDEATDVGQWHKVARFTQERVNLEEGAEIGEAESQFILIIKEYSTDQDISYAVWRQLGVPAWVLTEGGMRA